MSFFVTFFYRAETELSESLDYYDSIHYETGDEFVGEIKYFLKLIKDSPFLFAIHKGDVRKAVLKKFPFAILYRVNKMKSQIIIVAVFHTRRRPIKFR